MPSPNVRCRDTLAALPVGSTLARGDPSANHWSIERQEEDLYEYQKWASYAQPTRWSHRPREGRYDAIRLNALDLLHYLHYRHLITAVNAGRECSHSINPKGPRPA